MFILCAFVYCMCVPEDSYKNHVLKKMISSSWVVSVLVQLSFKIKIPLIMVNFMKYNNANATATCCLLDDQNYFNCS